MRIDERIKKRKKLSQAEIAAIFDISEKTVSCWENGESQIKPDKAQALADFFGVSVGDLLGYRDDLELFIHGSSNELEDLSTVKVRTNLHFLTNQEEIKQLKREILASIQFVENSISVLSHYVPKPQYFYLFVMQSCIFINY